MEENTRSNTIYKTINVLVKWSTWPAHYYITSYQLDAKRYDFSAILTEFGSNEVLLRSNAMGES